MAQPACASCSWPPRWSPSPRPAGSPTWRARCRGRSPPSATTCASSCRSTAAWRTRAESVQMAVPGVARAPSATARRRATLLEGRAPVRRARVLPRPGPLLRPRAALRHRRRRLLGQLRALRLLLPRGTRGAWRASAKKTAARPWRPQIIHANDWQTGPRARLPPHALPRPSDPGAGPHASSPSTTSPTRACSGTTTCR